MGNDKYGNESAEREAVARELVFLRRRVADLEQLHFIPGRHVLPANDDLLAGYLTLEREERRYTSWAIARHSAFVDVWYQFPSLLKSGIENAGNEDSQPEFTPPRELAFQFIAAAGGTVKLVLDAGLAGYYAQAYTLVRHLFETWLRLEYIKLRPEMADCWFVGSKGQEPQPPGEQKVHTYVLRSTKGDRRATVQQVLNKLQDLNKMAHPSQFTLQQTVGARENTFNIGANYDPELCVGVLHEGASGLRLILTALHELSPQPSEWRESLREAMSDQAKALELELGHLERMREQAEVAQHWIMSKRPSGAQKGET